MQCARRQRSACGRRVDHPELDDRRHVRHPGDDWREGSRPHPRERHRQGDQGLLPASHWVETPPHHGRRWIGCRSFAAGACQTLNPISSLVPHLSSSFTSPSQPITCRSVLPSHNSNVTLLVLSREILSGDCNAVYIVQSLPVLYCLFVRGCCSNLIVPAVYFLPIIIRL